MFFEIGVAVILIPLALVVLDVLSRLKEPSNLPPGPRILPLFLLGTSPKNLPHVLMAQTAKRYGPVYTVKIGLRNIVVVNGHEAAREALVQKGQDYSGRPTLRIVSMALPKGMNITLGDYGAVWKLQRKCAHTAIRMFHNGVGQLQEDVTREFRYLSERLVGSKGHAVDPTYDLEFTVLNVLSGLVFGTRYEFHDPAIPYIVQYVSKTARIFLTREPLLHVCPWLQYIPYTKVYSEAEQISVFPDYLCRKQLQYHRETLDKDHIRDFTDALLTAIEDAQAKGSEVTKCLTDEHIMLTILDVFLAGLDGISATIRWFIAYLVNYPQVQEKLHQEIDDVIGRDRLPSLDDKDKLPYLKATFFETLRHSSVAPMLNPHKAIVDTTLQGYNIPKDTMVMFNVWAIHNDPTTWENPAEFQPSRFLDSSGEFVCPKDGSFLAFGSGPRVCIGETLVKTTLVLFLSQLIHQFKFSCPADCPPPVLEPELGIIMAPKPFNVCIHKRDD